MLCVSRQYPRTAYFGLRLISRASVRHTAVDVTDARWPDLVQCQFFGTTRFELAASRPRMSRLNGKWQVSQSNEMAGCCTSPGNIPAQLTSFSVSSCASVRHTDACHSQGAQGTDREHPQAGSCQTAKDDGGKPGVRFLARSKRGTRFRTASPLGGTRQRRRRFCSPWVGRDQGRRLCRWRSPDDRNWLSFSRSVSAERSTPPARVKHAGLEPLPAFLSRLSVR